MKRRVLLSLALVACAVKSEAPLGTSSSSSDGASATVLGQTAAERAAVGEETHQVGEQDHSAAEPVFSDRSFGGSGELGDWKQFMGHCRNTGVPHQGQLAHSEDDLLRIAECSSTAVSGIDFAHNSMLIVHADFFGSRSYMLSVAGIEEGVLQLNQSTLEVCQGVAPGPPHGCTVYDSNVVEQGATPPAVCGKGLFGVEIPRALLTELEPSEEALKALEVSIRQMPVEPCPGGIR